MLLELQQLRCELLNGTYKQKPFNEFIISERGRTRNIKALHIRDRIIQRCLCDYILMPRIQRYLIYDNGASIKGKGISFTRKRFAFHLNKYYEQYGSEGYILKIDYSKFFDSIPHDKVLEITQRFVDDSVYDILADMIKSFGNEYSLGIGSQISQVIGVYYLTTIDNYCKIVKGIKYYDRYMDDIVIIHHDKEFLNALLDEITNKSNDIGLTINAKKTGIIKLSHGFTFLQRKYKLLEDGTIICSLSPETIARERRKLKKYAKMLNNGIITYKDVCNYYKSWRRSNEDINSYKSLQNMDELFYSLFEGVM